MKGIYLASYKAFHPDYDIVYQDINGKRDIGGDMLNVDLTPYDFIIATPPCNYYSRANYRRETSSYSQATKHLLPTILDKLSHQDKPFIVENVRNKRIFSQLHLYELPCFIYEIGRHTYWTNIFLDYQDVEQTLNFHKHGKFLTDIDNNRQGGENVHKVIEVFLRTISERGC